MDKKWIVSLLEGIKNNLISIDEAIEKLKILPFEEVRLPEEEFSSARIDHLRELRCGFPEVVFGMGKRTEEILAISEKIIKSREPLLITRTTREVYEAILAVYPEAIYNPIASTITIQSTTNAIPSSKSSPILIITGGTSDIPVAEEAAVTAEIIGCRIEKLYDVGVAGIHRLFDQKERILSASVIIVVAGMEGALASVVGGLVAVPVIAVPTSIGYGASFHGLAALLGMLTSCAPSVVVVNIDNGFGAGYVASLIAKRGGS